MSLAPQRPNFVLVWIGIILLTFSFLSNFFAGATSKGDKLAIGRDGKGEEMVPAPSDALPTPITPASHLVGSTNFLMGDEVPPLDFLNDFGNVEFPLAKQAGSAKKSDQPTFPVELLEPAVAQELDAASATKVLPLPPSTPVQNHALRKVAATGARPTHGGHLAPSAPQAQQANYLDTDLSLHNWNGKLQGLAPGGDSGVQIKAKLESVKQGNTVVVRFFFSQPSAATPLSNARSAVKTNPELLTVAHKYMRVVEEATAEEDPATALSSQSEIVKAAMRRDVIRLLRLHPGGLEIIAEMTPAQLRELADKLDARGAWLRAPRN
jgi:hypothetical protein